MEIQCVLMCHFQLSQRTLQWDQSSLSAVIRDTSMRRFKKVSSNGKKRTEVTQS